MTVLPDDVFRVAVALNDRGQPLGEARDRTIAGRSYYAAYLAIREAIRRRYALSVDYRPGHEDVCNALQAPGETEGVRACGILLNTLRLRRVRADYHISQTVQESEAEDAIEEAKELLRRVQAVEASLPKIAG